MSCGAAALCVCLFVCLREFKVIPLRGELTVAKYRIIYENCISHGTFNVQPLSKLAHEFSCICVSVQKTFFFFFTVSLVVFEK